MAEGIYIIHQYDLSVFRAAFILFASRTNHGVFLHVCGFVFLPHSFFIIITCWWLTVMCHEPSVARFADVVPHAITFGFLAAGQHLQASLLTKRCAAYNHGRHGLQKPVIRLLMLMHTRLAFNNEEKSLLKSFLASCKPSSDIVHGPQKFVDKLLQNIFKNTK